MKTFKKYLKILYQNKFSLLIYILIFAILIGFNNYSKKDDLSSNYFVNVVDKANNKDSKNLTKFLEEKYQVSTKDLTESGAKDLLFGGMTNYVLFIDKDNNLSYFSADDFTAPVAINMTINEYLNTYKTLNKFNVESPYDSTKNILSDNAEFEIINSSTVSKTENYYTYLTYVILSILLSIVFIVYFSFFRDGVQSRVRVSKTTLSKFNLSLYLSSTILVVLLCGVFSTLDYFLNDTKLKISLLMFLNLLLFAVPVVVLAYVISSLSKNSKMNGSLGNIISMTLCFISGAFVPQEYLPEYLLKFSSILPPYWYIKGIAAVQKLDYNTILNIFLIQLIITMVLVIINSAINRFKKGEIIYTR